MEKYNPTDAEKEAISLLDNEVTNWEEGEVYVTDDKSFYMKRVVKNARKNFFGIFEKEYDKVTKRKKLFIPLTEKLVEGIVKNIDIDTKDIKVKAKNSGAYEVAAIFRYVLKYYLDKVQFGKILNTIIRMAAIDGTAFVKTWKEKGELKIRVVDRLNIIADPSANDLTETPLIERNFLSIPEFRNENPEWANIDVQTGSHQIDRTGFDKESQHYTNKSEIPMVDVYERYGFFEKFILTNKESDRGDFVYGLIVASGLKDGGGVIHLIKEVKKNPFVIVKYKDIWNRLDGRGVAEMAFHLQAYINEIVNTRMNTARIAQMGLFKIRGGVTPQQFSKLFSTSAIKLKGARDDIERLDTGTVDPSSYRDEATADTWARDVTGAFDQNQVTASTPATNALIQERGTQQGFNLVQENIGFALEELIEDHVIPIIRQLIKKGDIIRMTGNAADFEKIQDKFIDQEVYTKAKDYIAAGGLLTDEEMEAEKESLRATMNRQGEDRFLEITDKAFDTDFDIDIQIGEDKLNPALIAQSVTQALGIAAQFPGSRINTDEALKEIFDSLGLDGNRLVQAEEELGEATARTEQAVAQGQVQTEAEANPTPMSSPVV